MIMPVLSSRRKSKGYWITGEALARPPSISTGVEGEGWILVFHVLDIKGFVVEPVPAQPHLSPGSTQKSNEGKCHDFENKKGKDFFVQSTIYNMCCIK
jgi:hypothetical protein